MGLAERLEARRLALVAPYLVEGETSILSVPAMLLRSSGKMAANGYLYLTDVAIRYVSHTPKPPGKFAYRATIRSVVGMAALGKEFQIMVAPPAIERADDATYFRFRVGKDIDAVFYAAFCKAYERLTGHQFVNFERVQD